MSRKTQPYILICDESTDQSRELFARLKQDNFRLAIVKNGRDACTRASVERPDLVLLEMHLPGMDGLATCKTLKSHEYTRGIPVLFFTNSNARDDRLAGFRCGALDYILKDADPEEVLLRIKVHLPHAASLQHASTSWHPHDVSALAQACIDLLEEDLSRTLKADEISRALETRWTNISHAFEAVHGTKVYLWLRERRIQQASSLLTQSNMPIGEIALSLGYTSAANFATAFKNRFKVNPRAYRQEAQSQMAELAHALQPA